MVSHIDSLIGERTERRRATATARLDPLLRKLRSGGFDLACPRSFGYTGASEGGACHSRGYARIRDLVRSNLCGRSQPSAP